MERKKLKRLPVGIQTFSEIREADMLYIDKTEYIYSMVNLSKYIFLSRPRRFGKSLLLSTLQAYFEGRKELFQGLAIERSEKEWKQYPVLRFDLSSGKHTDKASLERYLLYLIESNEQRFGITSDKADPNIRLKELITQVHEKTGRRAVVLIDEYDAPLLDVLHDEGALPAVRNVMRNFFSPLKACDPHLEFVFLTGITKFSQLSIFSELNNLTNISMLPDFASICGITKEEVFGQMQEYVEELGNANGWSPEETAEVLQKQYDGYHFTWPSPDLFNPFSLLKAFNNKIVESYWFESGTPTYLIEMMRKFDTVPSDMASTESMATEFDAPTESMTSILPLLYQSGYFTIKGYDRISRLYRLDVPNQEIHIGLMDSLLPHYAGRQGGRGLTIVGRMFRALHQEDLDGMLELLQKYLLTIPYCNQTDSEGHYQQMLYIIFSLMGRYADVEVHTPAGRVDMVMRTSKALYLFELKLNHSAAAAMKQIELKNYASRFALSDLPVVKVGINFDSEQHTISDWKIEK